MTVVVSAVSLTGQGPAAVASVLPSGFQDTVAG
jgi:hypothetical protein